LSSLAIASIVFLCNIVGTVLGILLGRRLPENHLSGDSKDAVTQGLGLIAALTALVLGLLIAATKGTFDTQSATITELATNVALLDRVLAEYGPESKDARTLLATCTRMMLTEMWPEERGQQPDLTASELRVAGDALFGKLSALDPKTDTQRMLKTRALEIAISLTQTRQRLLAQRDSTMPTPFLVVLGFWLTILFACYGLLAPRNQTVAVILFVCMLSVAGAVFLVLEMDKPFDGIMRVSSDPLRGVLARLGD